MHQSVHPGAQTICDGEYKSAKPVAPYLDSFVTTSPSSASINSTRRNGSTHLTDQLRETGGTCCSSDNTIALAYDSVSLLIKPGYYSYGEKSSSSNMLRLLGGSSGRRIAEMVYSNFQCDARCHSASFHPQQLSSKEAKHNAHLHYHAEI